MVFSNKGAEWHGTAIHKKPDGSALEITEEVLSPILFRVCKLENLVGTIDGISVPVPGLQVVAADLRHRNEGFTPLGTHTESYKIIENREVFKAMERAMDGIPHVITTAGTLNGCRRFFISVQLRDGSEFMVNGEKFHGVYNFITSHDGTLALQSYNSITRIVCNNTLLASLHSAKNAVRIKHLQNAPVEMLNMAEFINDSLQVRAEFTENYGTLMESRITHEEAQLAITGYMWNELDSPEKFSTRSKNVISGVMELFRHGRGNRGETVADLLNGYTDYFSNGRGTGIKSAPITRAVNSHFGNAAEKKARFGKILLSGDSADFTSLVAAGEKGGLNAFLN
jgi:hypothetical protein